MDEIIYQNKWCKIGYKGTLVVLQSKSGKYNDQYFNTIEEAKKSIGVKLKIKNYVNRKHHL